MNKIEAKKKELETSLSRIQEDLDKSLQEVKEDVGQTVAPKEIIRRFPLPVVGGAILLGFLLGTSGKRKNKSSRGTNTTVIDSITSSLKRKVTQKVTDAAMNYLEEKLSSRGENEKE